MMKLLRAKITGFAYFFSFIYTTKDQLDPLII